MTSRDPSRLQIAEAIDQFVGGGSGSYGWDDFMGAPFASPELERIRRACLEIPDLYPPKHPGEYCSEEGARVMRDLAAQLRATPN